MRRHLWRRFWGDGALPALLFFSLLAGVIHVGARRIGFIGDSWAILFHAAPGWREALGTPLGYHYIPLASGWTRILFLFFGDREPLYEIVNIAELAVVGWLTFLLGRRLLDNPLPGFLAGSLLIGSAAFPDITYWPLVGNFHCLAAGFAIGAIAATAALAEEGPPRGASWGFAAALAGACLTYEGMITLLPIAIGWCLVRTMQRAGVRSLFRLDSLKGLLRRFGPSLPVVAALILAKLRFAEATASAFTPGLDFGRLNSLAYGLLGIFTLRSSAEVLENILYLGTTPTIIDRTRILIFLGAALSLGVWTFLRARRGAALLVLWLAIHLMVAVTALPLSPRHRFLPSIPGLLLLSLGFCRVGEWFARRSGRDSAETPEVPGLPAPSNLLSTANIAFAVPLVLASVLALSAQGELRQAQDLYRRSSEALRLSVEKARALLALRTAPATVTLVNVPAYLIEAGITAPAFDNTIEGLVRFRLNGAGIELIYTGGGGPGWKPAGGSHLVDDQGLLRLTTDSSRAVVEFKLDKPPPK